MKRTPLKQGTKPLKRSKHIRHGEVPLKRSRPKPQSDKGKLRRELERALDAYLLEYRAGGLLCEICSFYPDFRGIGGAHIEPRDFTGANDTAENKVMACGRCHDHSKYAKNKGLCITQAEAKKLVAELNKKHGIDPKMTGADVLRMKGEDSE